MRAPDSTTPAHCKEFRVWKSEDWVSFQLVDSNLVFKRFYSNLCAWALWKEYHLHGRRRTSRNMRKHSGRLWPPQSQPWWLTESIARLIWIPVQEGCFSEFLILRILLSRLVQLDPQVWSLEGRERERGRDIDILQDLYWHIYWHFIETQNAM